MAQGHHSNPVGGCRPAADSGGLRALLKRPCRLIHGPRRGEGRQVRSDPGNSGCDQRHPAGEGMEEANHKNFEV